MTRRTWAEVDLSVLKKNYLVYRHRVAPRPVMAVVKANAYGHGMIPVARALQEAGADAFAVAALSEGKELREAGVRGEILILSYTSPQDASEIVKYDLTQTVVSREHGEALAAAGQPVKCHVALDTGMNRVGLKATDPDYCEKTVRELASRLPVTGLFTHLCVADSAAAEDVAFTRRQIALFEEVARRLSDLSLTAHCLNSAGGLYHGTETHGYARLGITLYGLKPDPANVLPEGIAPALSLKSTVSRVEEIHAGETVGYGRTFRATRPTCLATVTAGYGDGVPRALSNRGAVLIRGKRAPIVGRVCMDQITVDVTDVPGVVPGDTVTLIGRDGDNGITAEEAAALAGTINYELVTGILPRVERVYLS